jgi:hypothetical protein
MYWWIVGLLSCLEQMQHNVSANCTATHFAEVLQINTVRSTENISFSPTLACASTKLPKSFSLTCMHVHSPNKKHFSHTHAYTCVCVHAHMFFLPHVCITGCHHGLLIILIGDIRADIVIYTVWNLKLE